MLSILQSPIHVTDDRGRRVAFGGRAAMRAIPALLRDDAERTCKDIWGKNKGIRYAMGGAVGLVLLAMFGAVALTAALGTTRISPYWFTSVVFAMPVAQLVVLTVSPWARAARKQVGKTLVRTLTLAGYCPGCGYDLRAVAPDPDRCRHCPECGSAWHIEISAEGMARLDTHIAHAGAARKATLSVSDAAGVPVPMIHTIRLVWTNDLTKAIPPRERRRLFVRLWLLDWKLRVALLVSTAAMSVTLLHTSDALTTAGGGSTGIFTLSLAFPVLAGVAMLTNALLPLVWNRDAIAGGWLVHGRCPTCSNSVPPLVVTLTTLDGRPASPVKAITCGHCATPWAVDARGKTCLAPAPAVTTHPK